MQVKTAPDTVSQEGGSLLTLYKRQRGCATRSAGQTIQMTKPTPSSAETLLRQSSWAGFVIGAGLILVAMVYEKQSEESHVRSEFYRGEVAAGRLTVDPSTLALMDKNTDLRPPDYWEARTGGLALILVGLGCSLYANKLRKARTGE